MSSARPAPPPTLVEYDAPLLVEGDHPPGPGGVGGRRAPSDKGDGKVDDILNSILPPRMWDQVDGSTWIQYVSQEPSGRDEVRTLQERLDRKLTERQARQHGICAVREELYAQCFQELIRQVTLESPERGLLLLRVRDEARMTLDAYRTLFEASVTFGVRKQLQAEEGMPALRRKVEELRAAKQRLDARVLTLRNQADVLERRHAERKALEAQRFKEEIDFLRHQNKHLEHFLRSLPGAGGK